MNPLPFLLAVVVAAPLAYANPLPFDPQAPPPRDFTASIDAENGTVRLSWSAPGNGTYNYTLYRDGNPLAVLTGTSYNDTRSAPLTAYWLTATANHQVSEPAAVVIFGGGPVPGAICWPVGIVIDTSWPFVDVGVNPECIPFIHYPPSPGNAVNFYGLR